MKSTSNQAVSSNSMRNHAGHSQPSPKARARNTRPHQQWSSLKLALTVGSIAATLLGTNIIAAKDNVATAAQAPVSAVALNVPADRASTIQPGALRQSNGTLTRQSPFVNRASRHSLRPLTRSRSSR